MLRRFTKKRAIVALSSIAVLAVAGGAFAYFTSTGSGSTTATVGAPSQWQIGTPAAVSGQTSLLVPESKSVTQNTDGSPGGIAANSNVDEWSYAITNPSAGNEYLSKVHVSIDPSSFSGVTGCSASDFSLNGASAGTEVDDTSQKGDFTAGQSKTGYVTVEMIDSNTDQNGCKNVKLTLDLNAS